MRASCPWGLLLAAALVSGGLAAAGHMPDASALHTGQPVPLSAASGPLRLDHYCEAWIETPGRQQVEAIAGSQVQWRPCAGSARVRAAPGQAYWMRFSVQADHPAPWFLDLGSPEIALAELYHREPEGPWHVLRAGSRLPLRDWALPGREPAFALAPEAGRTTVYLLRMEPGRLPGADPTLLLPAAQFHAVREREQFLFGLHAGVSLLVTLAALANGLWLRDRGFLVFSVCVALLGLAQLARAGIAYQYLWPQAPAWNEASRLLLSGVGTAAALWFVRTVTEPRRLAPRLDTAAAAWTAVLLGAAALDAVISDGASLTLLLACIAVALLLMAALVVHAARHGQDATLRLFALAWLPLLVLAFLPLGRSLHLIPDAAWARYGLLIGTLVQIPALYYVMNVRALRRRESEARAAALSHTDALTGLSLRTPFVERLAAALERARSQRQACALLVMSVANAEALQAQYGRDIAQRALVVAASELTRSARLGETAARVGEHEFALLLEAPATPHEVLARAQQVVAGGLRSSPALPRDALLRLHVVAALLPQEELGAEPTLQWALAALAQMSAQSRKLIRPLNFPAPGVGRGFRPS